MPEYSPLYQRQLAAIGEPTKPGTRRSGRLLDDLRVLRFEVSENGVRIVFGVGDGTSPRTPRPPPWVFSGTPEEQAKSLARWRSSSKRPTQSAPHPQLLELIIEGGPHRPGREVLGISPEGMKEIAAELRRFALFK